MQVAHGPVDYSILFDWIDLVLTEAKKDALDVGIVQNYLQLFASKQFIANTIMDRNVYGSEKKRKFKEAFDSLAGIPSYGIVSTGYKWVLTSTLGGMIALSSEIFLDLEGTINRETLSSLISRIVAIVLNQMTAVTESEDCQKIGLKFKGLNSGQAVIMMQSEAAHEYETQMEQHDEHLNELEEMINGSD